MARNRSTKRVLVLLSVFVATVATLATPANAARCNPRKSACSSADTSAPSISIASPASGATVAATITVSGSASDNASLAKVEVKIDAGAFSVASGTGSWSYALNTAAYSDGAHTITARATDAAGNVASTSRSITFANTTSSSTDRVVAEPGSNGAQLPGGGRMVVSNGVAVLIYQAMGSNVPWAFFQDLASGASSYVSLPVNQVAGADWAHARYVFAGTDLHVLSGSGPIYARHYRLSGAPLPTGASLLSSQTFGTSDSRMGDLIGLASGALVATWHQQGATGPQGQGVAYRSIAGAWSTLPMLTYVPTASAFQAAAQHPVDGSVWIFNDADAKGSIGAAHLSETSSGLQLDWTSGSFISSADGEYAPDPENPNLQAAPDPSTGTVALAYQSTVRTIFSTSPFLAGSHIAVARIAADASKSFISLPVYVERISQIGLAVRAGETWLGYRPIDPATKTFNAIHVSKYAGGTWTHSGSLGTLYAAYGPIAFGVDRGAFAATLTDGKLHLFTPRL